MSGKRRKSRNISKKTGIYGIIICLVALVILAIRFINPDLYNEVSKTLFGEVNNIMSEGALNEEVSNEDNFEINVTNPENLKDVTIKTSKEITSDFVSNDQTSLKVYFFDVGQADSMLIQNNGENMLIDAGNNEDGEMLVNNLKTLGVEKIDYLVGTHPHEDHIGGMDDIIKNFSIGKIFMPSVSTNTKTFEDVIDAAKNKGLQIETPKIGDKFTVGSANCNVVYVGDDKENLNLSSIIIKLEYNKLNYLFTGDAEAEIENKIDVGKINILKVGHHGSDTSSSEKLVKEAAPEVAIISVGKDNSYGHPSDKIIKRYEEVGSKIYRTDEVGNIFIEQK